MALSQLSGQKWIYSRIGYIRLYYCRLTGSPHGEKVAPVKVNQLKHPGLVLGDSLDASLHQPVERPALLLGVVAAMVNDHHFVEKVQAGTYTRRAKYYSISGYDTIRMKYQVPGSRYLYYSTSTCRPVDTIYTVSTCRPVDTYGVSVPGVNSVLADTWCCTTFGKLRCSAKNLLLTEITMRNKPSLHRGRKVLVSWWVSGTGVVAAQMLQNLK